MYQSVNITNLWYKLRVVFIRTHRTLINTTMLNHKHLLVYLRVLLHLGNKFLQKKTRTSQKNRSVTPAGNNWKLQPDQCTCSVWITKQHSSLLNFCFYSLISHRQKTQMLLIIIILIIYIYLKLNVSSYLMNM